MKRVTPHPFTFSGMGSDVACSNWPAGCWLDKQGTAALLTDLCDQVLAALRRHSTQSSARRRGSGRWESRDFLLVRIGGGEGDSRKSAAVQIAKLSTVQQRGFLFKGLRMSVLKSCLRIFPPMSQLMLQSYYAFSAAVPSPLLTAVPFNLSW